MKDKNGFNDQTSFTDRDASFVEKWADSGFSKNQKAAIAVEAGFKPGMAAHVNAGRITKTILNNVHLQDAMKRRGLDWDTIAGKLVELLDAESPIYEGKPDNIIQHRALETAIRVMDANPSQKIDVDRTMHHELVISNDVVERLAKYNRMVLEDDPNKDAITVEAEEVPSNGDNGDGNGFF